MLIKGIENPSDNELHNEIVKLLEAGRLPESEDFFYSLTSRTGSAIKPLLEDYFANVSQEIKDKVLNCIKENPIELCESCSCSTETIDYSDASLTSQLEIVKKLFEYFFKKRLGDTNKLKEHYDALQLKVCPFCTLSKNVSYEYSKREAYDHFLPISKYPYWGADLKNLAPMCTVCNSYIKNDRDPLYNSEGRRQEILYPYQDISNFEVKLNSLEGEPVFEISSINAESGNKLKNFVDFFDLKERFKAEFKQRQTVWFDEYILKEYESTNITKEQFKVVVETEYLKQAQKRLKDEPCKFLEKAYYEFMLNNLDSFYNTLTA